MFDPEQNMFGAKQDVSHLEAGRDAARSGIERAVAASRINVSTLGMRIAPTSDPSLNKSKGGGAAVTKSGATRSPQNANSKGRQMERGAGF